MATKLACGSTEAGNTNWKQVANAEIFVEVDTSAAGLSQPPTYITSLGGITDHWMATGIETIINPTKDSFGIALRAYQITPELANQRQWHVNWAASTDASVLQLP